MRYSTFTKMTWFEQNIILISGDGIFGDPEEWTSTKSSLVNPIETPSMTSGFCIHFLRIILCHSDYLNR